MKGNNRMNINNINKNFFVKIQNILFDFFKGEKPDTVDYIGGSDVLPPPLSKEEEQQTFELMKTDPKKAKDLLIVHNLRLVVYIAKKFENTGLDIEDLISTGSFGLIKAVNTFRPDKNIKLATYASRCIENEILMAIRKTVKYKNDISIDEPLNTDWDGNELLLSDILGTDDDTVTRGVENEAEKQVLRREISMLGERERMIMEMRFGLVTGEEMTQKQVADCMGISQSYISRLEKRILKSIRENLEKI